MSNIWKAAKLDFALIKSYSRTMAIMIVWPVIIVAINRSLYSGISFAMCFVSITASYPFSIAEKNSMERFYGILPVRKSSLVIGRYVYVILLGLTTLIFSLIAHSFVLRMMGETVQFIDIAAASVMGIFLFTFFTVFQLPGFYKYGTIKGRIFIYVPVVGLLGIMFLLSKLPASIQESLDIVIDSSPALLAVLFIAVVAAMYMISIMVSVRIFKNKEM